MLVEKGSTCTPSPKVAHITTIDLSLRFLLLNQLQSLQAAGYDVIGISAFGPDVPVLEASGIRHIAVPMTRRFSPLPDLLSLWRLYRVIRRERFTIVHTHNPKPGLLGQVAAWLAGTPIIVNTVHGFYFHEGMKPFWRWFYITVEKIAARCSDVILSQNREDMLTAVTTRICSPEKIKYLGNGIDIARFNRDCLPPETIAHTRATLGIPPDAPVVGFVGRLVAEKGILELLAAARQVVTKIPQTHFLIVGPLDTEKADALTPAIAADYGLADACIFTGMRQDMPELYALMDLFVLPSHREGFPRSPMEASAMGVPCVVTDIRGCREAVTHGRNGYLTRLSDVDALAAAILDLLTDKEKARQMGQNGRQMAEELFDEQLVFARVKAEYARLLQTKGIISSAETAV
ncbi:MAG: glycosyltransferase family 4 protein [Anaerolineae bacterium]|nr:glycosyltransferase family 4 protein [Anaerolineae bacterium]